MKKKIFVMGKVYDLAKQEISEIENEIQTDLDKFSAGGIRFKIDITSEKTLELIFTRQYRDGEIDWLNYDSKTIYCTDAKIITGHGFDGFEFPSIGEESHTVIHSLCQRRNLLGAIRSQRLNLEEAG